MNDHKRREAEGEYKRAVELKPSRASTHHWYYLLLEAEMRKEEARYHIEKAVELDPRSPVIRREHTEYYGRLERDYGKALELIRKANELDPKLADAHGYCAWLNGKLNRFDDARTEGKILAGPLRDSHPLVDRGVEAFVADLEGDKETVRRLLPELKVDQKEALVGAVDLAQLHFDLGETDQGFEWLEAAYKTKEWPLTSLKSFDFLDGVRDDPSYLDLLKRLGLDQTTSHQEDSNP